MFEYDGDQYTEQEIIDAASKAGLSFEDYTSKHGILSTAAQKGKTNATAEETAPVVAETPADTDLQLEDGSSELQGNQQGPSQFAEEQKQPIPFLPSYEEKNNIKVEPTNAVEVFENTQKQLKDIKLSDFSSPSKLLAKATQNDDFVTSFSQNVFDLEKDKIEGFKTELSKKYDLSNADGVNKANKELDTFTTNMLKEAMEGSDGYKTRLNTYTDALVQKQIELINSAELKAEKENEEQVKALADFAFRNVPFLPDSVKKGGLRLMYTVPQAVDLGMPVTGALSKLDDAASLGKILERIETRGGVPSKKGDGVFVTNISGGSDKYESNEAAIKDYQNKIQELYSEGLGKIVESQQYQEMIDKFGAPPEVWDEDGLTGKDFGEMFGTQAGQMVMSILPPLIYAQEAGGMLTEVLEGKGQEKFGEKWGTMSQEDKNKAYEHIVKSGEIDYTKLELAGGISSSLDVLSNLFGASKIAKGVGGSVARNLVKRNFKGAVKASRGNLKEIVKAQLAEVPTEITQEAITGTTVGGELGTVGITGKEVLEVGTQALITSGPLIAVGRGTKGTIRQARKLAGLEFKSKKEITNQIKQEVAAVEMLYENGSVDKAARDEQLTAIYEAESIARNSKYKNFETEAKEDMVDLEIQKKILTNKNESLKTEYTAENVFSAGQIAANEEEIQKLEEKRKNVLNKQITLNMGNKFRDYINNNSEKFNGFTYSSFETAEQAEDFLIRKGVDLNKENVQGLINGDNYAITLDGQKIIVDVKENLKLGKSGVGGNAVHHEGIHAILNSSDDSTVQSIVDGIKQFSKESGNKDLLSIVNDSELRVSTDYSTAKSREANEEFLASVSDFMRVQEVEAGDVQVTTALSKIGNRIAQALGKGNPESLDFSGLKDGAETIAFLRKYNSFNGNPLSNIKLPTPKKGSTDVETSEKPIDKNSASKIVQEVKFEDDSINERFKAFTYDGKKNNAPESFHAEAAYQYEPLAQGVVKTLANKGLISGSPEQNNLIMGYLEDPINRQELVEQLVVPVGGDQASSLLGLAKSFDPSKGSFGGYAKGFLAARAIRQLKNKMQGSFIGSQKIDSPESREIAAEDKKTETADTRSVFEKFNFKPSLKNKADGLVELGILNVENKLKGQTLSNAKKISARTKGLSDVYKKIAPDVKKAIGKGKDFDNFLDSNWENIGNAYIDNVVVSKGRGGGISPFSEGFTKKDIVDYFKGNDLVVGQLNKNDKPLTKDQKTRTVSTRKTRSLPEAISRQIANESLKDYVANDPEINDQFQKDYGFALASKVLKDLKTKDQTAFDDLSNALKQIDNDYLSNNSYKWDQALNNVGIGSIFERIYGEKRGKVKFNNLVKDFEKEFSSMEKVEPTFVYNGKPYTLAGFITDKILSEIENDSYALQVEAITGRKLSLDWGDPAFISRVQESYAKVGAVMGKEWMDRFLSKGLKAPSKIGNGTLTVDENFNLVFSNKAKETNRFGLFRTKDHYNLWAESQNFPNIPINANEFATDSAKPFHKWAIKSKTPEGIKTIQLSGISDNQAFVDLIDTVKKLGIGIDETVGMLMSMNNNPLGLTRRSAILDFMPTKVFEGEYLLEHMTPALVINLAALDYIHNKNTDPSNFKKLMKTYRLAQLPKKYDDIVNEYYKSHMPFYFKPGDVSIIRYYNPEIGKRFDLKLKTLSTGTVIDKTYYKDNSKQEKSQSESLAVFDLGDKAMASKIIFEPNTPGDFNEASTAYKAIFMVGSPGGGKTNVGKGLKLGRRGYKVVNQDIALEALKKAAGLPENESNYDKEQRSLRSKLGSRAVKAGKDKFQQYKNEGKGFLVDGTGASYNATTKKINELKEAGYDVYLVAAMTPKDVAIGRNKARKERSLPTFVVSKSYNQVVESLAKYKQDYGDKVFELDTTTIGFGEALPQEFLDKVYNGITQTKVAKSTLDKVAENKVLASKILSDEFNEILERVKGVKAEARYSEDRANKLAGNKGKFKFFVPYSAEDYVGLIYPTLGKGKEGDRNLQWYKDNIINPFAVGIADFEKAKVESLEQWRDLKKQISKTPAKLNKEAVRGFTNEEALRVYLWNEQDVVPDTLAKKDVEALVKYIEDSKELTAFAENVKDIVGVGGYPAPGNNWLSGSLTIDLIDNINTGKRTEFLQQWQDNVDSVYSKDNMNKLKALYGERYTEALENILYRMKTGRNRPSGATRLENQFMNWVNDSVGTVMFFNTRSALLQTISAVNFLNWSDNNPLMAAKAFANQPRFWKDFADLFNSDFLKSRRSGLKNDINADELAKSAATSDNKVRAGLSALLKAGFLPTQIADSFAISIGGASFYRNRLNTYKKQGLSEEQAKEKAMLDFQETAEESQQSSRPDRVSMQQASSLGRVILAFANTPMQYTRLTKKAALDLVNGRGDWKTNMSKILYYGAVQNIIFTALQQAMFAMLLDDDEIDDEEQTKASAKIVNGIADTFLRGSGVGGAAVATMKNIIMEIIKQKESKRPDYTKAALKLTTLSPPIDTKIRKLMSAGRAFTYRQSLKDMNRLGVDIDNPAALATGQVLSAVANLPADRAILKMRNVKGALDTEHEAWQRIAMGLGFSDWQLGIDKDKSKNDKPKIIKFTKPKSGGVKFVKPGSKKSPTKKLERGVAGRANNDGTIEIDPNLSPVEREKTIAHEKQHMKDMKAGKLNYDDSYVYWNNSKYERKNGKIKYKGKSYIEGHKDLPWEKKAYAAEPSTAQAKKRIKLYA